MNETKNAIFHITGIREQQSEKEVKNKAWKESK